MDSISLNIPSSRLQAWTNETNPRLGLYNTNDDQWKFVYYPLDSPESTNGGWVGLSDIAPVGNGNFLILERDNQGMRIMIVADDTSADGFVVTQVDQMQ